MGTDLTVLDQGTRTTSAEHGRPGARPVQKVDAPLALLYHLYQIGWEEIHNRVMAAKQEFQGLSGRSIRRSAPRSTAD